MIGSSPLRITPTPRSAEDWLTWIKDQERRTLEAYRCKPALMIAGYRTERSISRDYRGREILELIQNAADAAAEVGTPGRILLSLNDDGLLVANTGLPFSSEGVLSLQTDHLSPKRHSNRHLIGNKGLGFRSVLNWSSTPIILSGSLNLFYSTTHHDEVFQRIVSLADELSEVALTGRADEGVPPLAFLPFPCVDISAKQLVDKTSNGNQRRILADCMKAIDDGYDTAIGMPFDRPEDRTVAQEQLNQVDPEFLLFMDSINQLTIRSRELNTTWSLECDGDERAVREEGQPTGRWRIFCRSGSIPPDSLDADEVEACFQVAIALPLDRAGIPGRLHSFFPTDVQIPHPLLCHATLELTSNRKHPTERRSNAWVLRQLAETLADVAEARCTEPYSSHRAGLELVIPSSHYPLELERANFEDALLAALRTKRFIPTMTGKIVTPAEARIIPGADPQWLPPSQFADVAITNNQADFNFLRRLSVAPLSENEFHLRIDTIKDFSLGARVAFIAGILEHSLPASLRRGDLLIDQAGYPVRKNTEIYLPPVGADELQLPDWVEVSFLNQDMQTALLARLNARDVRQLQHRLSDFGVREYSLANLVRTLVRDSERRAGEGATAKAMTTQELVRSLLELYRWSIARSQAAAFPPGLVLQVPTATGSYERIDKLYLGTGYGLSGTVTDALYRGWASERLLAAPSDLGFDSTDESVESFLEWIGASRWPRITRGVGDSTFLQYVLDTIEYPARFGDEIYTKASDIPEPQFANLETIPELEVLLRNAASCAILAWLARDSRASDWQRISAAHGGLTCRPYGTWEDNRRVYDGPLPSFIGWTLKNRPWLLTSQGGVDLPRNCFITLRLLENHFPHPAPLSEGQLAAFRLSGQDLQVAWARAGVLYGIESLSHEELYTRLLELPTLDPNGGSARAFYRLILESNDLITGPNPKGSQYRRFMQLGKLWGSLGADSAYFNVADLFHADVEGFPAELLRQLPMVDLPRRVGSEKVEAVFGVRALEKTAIKRTVYESLPAPDAEELSRRFERSKPYLLALRKAQTAQTQYLQSLQELKLLPCSMAMMSLEFRDQRFDYNLKPWIGERIGKELYIVVDSALSIEDSIDLVADALGEAIGTMFRLGEGGDFARMFRCGETGRATLLHRMLGESTTANIDSIMREIIESERLRGILDFPIPLEALDPGSQPLLPTADSRDSDRLESGDNPTGPVPIPSVLEVNPIQHMPLPPASHQALQVRSASRASRTTHLVQVDDGTFAERKAFEFEQDKSQGRFPLLVGRLTGYQGPRCDILSFATTEDREAFVLGPHRDLGLIERFIEVKGRADPRARIELTGNELQAARDYRGKYYVYRIFEADPGSLLLSILCDPLSQAEALEHIYRVNLDLARTTVRFELEGGLMRQTAPIIADSLIPQ